VANRRLSQASPVRVLVEPDPIESYHSKTNLSGDSARSTGNANHSTPIHNVNYRSSTGSSVRLSTSDLTVSPTLAVSSPSSSPIAAILRPSNASSSTSNTLEGPKRRLSSTRREPKLAPEIIFLIREHAKTLESISLITRKLHEIEVKVDQMSTKWQSNDHRDASNAIASANGNRNQSNQTNVTHRTFTLDTCHSSKRASTSSTSAGLTAVPNVLSDDSGGEYGRTTNTTNTNSGDEDELLSLLDKITKCSHHIQQTQAVASAQTTAVLHSIDARLPSTAGSTATYLGSQYASPIACNSAVSTAQPIQLTNAMFNPAMAAQHQQLLAASAAQQHLSSTDLYQTARQTPHLAYANHSIAAMHPIATHPSAYSAPPFQAAAPLPTHVQHLLHTHPHLTQTMYATPAYLHSSMAPLTALPMPSPYAPSQPTLAQQHPLHSHLQPSPQQHLPPTLHGSSVSSSQPAMNAILFEPNVERFLHNLDQLVNADERHAHVVANSNAMMMSGAGGNGVIGPGTTNGLSAILNPTGLHPYQTAYATSAANSSKPTVNWQMEKASELLAKKERQNIDARYKLADEWLANCLARDSSAAGNGTSGHHSHAHHHYHHAHHGSDVIGASQPASSPSNVAIVTGSGQTTSGAAGQSSTLITNSNINNHNSSSVSSTHPMSNTSRAASAFTASYRM
jgi:hypothetical protein